MKMIKNFATLAYYNLKHEFLLPFFSSAGVLILTSLLFNTTGLQEIEAVISMENFLCFTGVTMLAPIFYPEQNQEIRDVIRAKKTDYLTVCLVRTVYSVLALAFLVGVFLFLLSCGESEVSRRLFYAGFGTALFLGAVAFAAAGISGNVVIGYMAGLLYYLASMGLKEKLGVFCLVRITTAGEWDKGWLYAGAAVLVGVTFLVLRLRR